MVRTGKTQAGCLAMALMAAAMIPDTVSAQALVIDKPRFTLTMPAGGWDSIAVPEGQGGGGDLVVLAKLQGLGGIAYVSCEPGTAAPNLDTIGDNFESVLGGTITRGRDSSLTLGKYAVRWQEFRYDSLPILSDLIQSRAPFIPRLRNGSFRVYYLVSDGYVFTVAGLSVFAAGLPPYGDIETALKTLVLKPQAGSVRFAAGRSAGGLWIRAGLLGGDRLKTHPVLSVDCYALDGAFAGAARPTPQGEWRLPDRRDALVVRVRGRDGGDLTLLSGP